MFGWGITNRNRTLACMNWHALAKEFSRNYTKKVNVGIATVITFYKFSKRTASLIFFFFVILSFGWCFVTIRYSLKVLIGLNINYEITWLVTRDAETFLSSIKEKIFAQMIMILPAKWIWSLTFSNQIWIKLLLGLGLDCLWWKMWQWRKKNC